MSGVTQPIYRLEEKHCWWFNCRYIDHPDFQPETVAKQSRAAMSLCLWVRAMDRFHIVNKVVEPKKLKLQKAENELKQANDQLKVKMDSLQVLSAELWIDVFVITDTSVTSPWTLVIYILKKLEFMDQSVPKKNGWFLIQDHCDRLESCAVFLFSKWNKMFFLDTLIRKIFY